MAATKPRPHSLTRFLIGSRCLLFQACVLPSALRKDVMTQDTKTWHRREADGEEWKWVLRTTFFFLFPFLFSCDLVSCVQSKNRQEKVETPKTSGERTIFSVFLSVCNSVIDLCCSALARCLLPSESLVFHVEEVVYVTGSKLWQFRNKMHLIANSALLCHYFIFHIILSRNTR